MADTTTTSGTGGIDWATLLPQLFSGYQAWKGTAGTQAQTAANAADPWGPQRGKYQTELNSFMADPSTIFQDPAYKAALGQGLEGVQRTLGAQGMGNSGNNAAALMKYGDTFAYNAENNKFNQLSQLAGVNAGSPAAAAAALMQGNNNQNANTAGGLAGAAGLISALMNSGIPKSIATQIAQAFAGGSGSSVNSDGTINYGTTTGAGDQGGFPGDTGGGYTPDPSTVPIDFSNNSPGSDWSSGLLNGGSDLGTWVSGGDLLP